MSALTWGKRYLMCAPTFFEVAYEINPWMHKTVRVDADLAMAQWQGLVTTLKTAGAEVELEDPVPGLPDLVFTANAGVIQNNTFVPSRFRHNERKGEVPFDVSWFSSHGYRIDELPEDVDCEGAGDALPFRDVFLAGYSFRSDLKAHVALSNRLARAVRSIELVDERLYHFDLTFCPLDDRRALTAPLGWDRYGARLIAEIVPEPLPLDEKETFDFCANSVVVGTTVIMPSCTPRLGKQLEAWGFDIAVCEVGEFLKAGGGCRCLTLALDVGSDEREQGGSDAS